MASAESHSKYSKVELKKRFNRDRVRVQPPQGVRSDLRSSGPVPIHHFLLPHLYNCRFIKTSMNRCISRLGDDELGRRSFATFYGNFLKVISSFVFQSITRCTIRGNRILKTGH
jgi:hypothetical protein